MDIYAHGPDVALVSALLQAGTFEPIIAAKLTPEHLTGNGKAAYVFIRKFYKQHGTMPSAQVVAKQANLARLPKVKEPLDYWIGEILDRVEGKLLEEKLGSAAEALRDGKLDECKKAVTKALQESPRHHSSIRGTATVKSWHEKFLTEVAGGGVTGIPTPWQALTQRTGGIRPGEFWLTIGKMKSRKTFTLCQWAKTAWQAGKSFCFFSAEMAAQHIEDRLYAVFSGINANHIRNRVAPKETQDKLADFVKTAKKGPKFWIFGPGECTDSNTILLALKDTGADIGFIDSVYRIAKGSGRRPMWEEVSLAVNDLTQTISDQGIPIVATSQFNRSLDGNAEKTDADVSKMGYAFSMAQAADAVLFYFQDEEDKRNKTMSVTLKEYRYGEPISLKVNCDVRSMNFDQISVEGETEIPNPVPAEVDAGIPKKVVNSPKDTNLDW